MRADFGAGDHPNIAGPDVLLVDARDCGLRPLVVCDLFGPLPFRDGTFKQIVSHHTLEHNSWRFVDPVLAEWVRVLAYGCAMHIEVPDLRWQAAQILKNPNDMLTVNRIYGDHTFPNDTNVHRMGFTHPLLEKALRRAGLTSVTVREVGGCLVADGIKQ